MITEDWEKIEVGSIVYALKDLYSSSDCYGTSRMAKRRDKLIVRGFSEYSTKPLPWVSHEEITDGTGFYISKSEVSFMKPFDHYCED